ncbi:MAG TPA: PBP1A family penicillin-binding protein [Ktedonobacteraceae bacterium]|nr:PBP1A family penicillin-binding protein [Ktedonobacteraceae bacterium]
MAAELPGDTGETMAESNGIEASGGNAGTVVSSTSDTGAIAPLQAIDAQSIVPSQLDPVTPLPEEEGEQTIELTPQQQRVLRYLARRHMRNVRVTRRQSAGNSKPGEIEESGEPEPTVNPESSPAGVTSHKTQPLAGIFHFKTQPLRDIFHLATQPLANGNGTEPDLVPAASQGVQAPLESNSSSTSSLANIEPMEPLMPNPLHGRAIGASRTAHHPHLTLAKDLRRRRRHHKIMLRHLSRKHMRAARTHERHSRRRLWTTIASSILALLVVLLSLGGTGAYVSYRFYNSTQQTYGKNLFTLRDLLPLDNLKIFDSKGILIGQLADNGIHTTVKLAQVSPYIINATVATEDKDFWINSGVDLAGIIRAAITNLENGRVVEGGSTITQQLIKNLVVGNDPTYIRKLQEVILAPQLNSMYSKRDILEMYLNSIYYGHQAYGIDAAATVYFGLQDSPGRTAAQQLDLAQSAMLAGLPSNPSEYDPALNFSTATQRFETVLNLMVSQGYITRLQAQSAIIEEQGPHFFKTAAALQDRAPHFTEFVLEQLEQMFHLKRSDLSRSGMRVYTTLDIGLQDKIQKIMQQHIAELRDTHHVTNAAEVLIDFHTGAIISLLGSIDYNNTSIDGQFDVATAYRQPGSSFKPYVYVTAFAQGASPAQAIDDAPITIPVPDSNPPTFSPSNYDLHFHGHMTLRCALQNSLNVPAVKVLQHVGINNAMQTAYKMGITSYEGTPGYSLVLGGLGIRLIDHTSAMGVFANGGVRVPYYAINKIVSGSTGKVLFQHQFTPGKQVISPQLAYMMTSVLSDNNDRLPEFYDCNVLQLYSNSQQDCYEGNRGVVRPAAAKTGTTQNFRDNWTVGYTTDFVMGVWAGNDDNSAMYDVTGVQGAAPIWHDAMLLAEKGHPIRNFTNPGGLVRATVTYPDGVQTTDWFLPGTVPNFSSSSASPTPTASGTPGPNPEPTPAPSGPVPGPYCPGDYTFAFPPPAGNTPSSANAGWW